MGGWDKQAITSYPGLLEDTMSINKLANLNVDIFILSLKVEMLGWKDCSVVRGTGCSSKMDLGSIPNTYLVAHDYLAPQFQGGKTSTRIEFFKTKH